MKQPVKPAAGPVRYRVCVPNVWTSRGLLVEGDMLPEDTSAEEIEQLKGKVHVGE